MPQAFSPTRPTLTISPGLSPKASKRISPRSPRASRDPQYWDPQAVSEHIRRHVPQEKSPLLAKLVLDQHLDGHALLQSPRDVLETALRVDEESQQYLMTAIDDLRARSLLPPSPRRKVQSLQQIVERLCDLASASSSPAGSATPELEPAAPADSPPPTTPVWDYGEEPNASSVQPFAYDHDHTHGHYLSFPGDPNEGFAPLLHPFEPSSPNHPDVLSALQVPRALHASTSSSSILARLESAVSVESGDHHGLAHGVQTRDDLPSHAVVPPGRNYRQPFHLHTRPRSCPPERPVRNLQPPHLTQAPPLNTFRRPTPPPKTYRTVAVQTADLVDAEIQTDAMDWRSTGSEATASVPTSAPSASARSSYASAAETISDGPHDASEGTRDISQSHTGGQVVSSPVDLVESREEDQHQTTSKTENIPQGSNLPEMSQDASSSSSNVTRGRTEATVVTKEKVKETSGQSASNSRATTSSSSKKTTKSPEPDQQLTTSKNTEHSATGTPTPTTTTEEKAKAVQNASSPTAKDPNTAPPPTSDVIEHKPGQSPQRPSTSRKGSAQKTRDQSKPAPVTQSSLNGTGSRKVGGSDGQDKQTSSQSPAQPDAAAAKNRSQKAKLSAITTQNVEVPASSKQTPATEEKSSALKSAQGASSSTPSTSATAMASQASSGAFTSPFEINSAQGAQGPADATAMADASIKGKGESSPSDAAQHSATQVEEPAAPKATTTGPQSDGTAQNTASLANVDATTVTDEQTRTAENKRKGSGGQTSRPPTSRQNSRTQQGKQEASAKEALIVGQVNEGNSEQKNSEGSTILPASESAQPVEDVKEGETQSGSTNTIGDSNLLLAGPSTTPLTPSTHGPAEEQSIPPLATAPPSTPASNVISGSAGRRGSQDLRIDTSKIGPANQHPEPIVSSLLRANTFPSSTLQQSGPSPLPTPPEKAQSHLRTTSSSGRGDGLPGTQLSGSAARGPPWVDAKARPGMDRSNSVPATGNGVNAQSGQRPPAGGYQQGRSHSTDALRGYGSALPPATPTKPPSPVISFGSHKPKPSGGWLGGMVSAVSNFVSPSSLSATSSPVVAQQPAHSSSRSPDTLESQNQSRGRDTSLFTSSYEYTPSPLNPTFTDAGPSLQGERSGNTSATTPTTMPSASKSKWARPQPRAQTPSSTSSSNASSREGTKTLLPTSDTHVASLLNTRSTSTVEPAQAPPPSAESPAPGTAPPLDMKEQQAIGSGEGGSGDGSLPNAINTDASVVPLPSSDEAATIAAVSGGDIPPVPPASGDGPDVPPAEVAGATGQTQETQLLSSGTSGEVDNAGDTSADATGDAKELSSNSRTVESVAPVVKKTESQSETDEVTGGFVDLGRDEVGSGESPETLPASSSTNPPAHDTTETLAQDPTQAQLPTANVDADGVVAKSADAITAPSQQLGQDEETNKEQEWDKVEHTDADLAADAVVPTEPGTAAGTSGEGEDAHEGQTHETGTEGFVEIKAPAARPLLSRLETTGSLATSEDGGATPTLGSDAATPSQAAGSGGFQVPNAEEYWKMNNKARRGYKNNYSKHFGHAFTEPPKPPQ